MRLFKRKGYEETTLRMVTDDQKNMLGLVGTVKDLVEIGLFDYCTADENKWVALPSWDKDGKYIKFANTREDAAKTLII